MLFQLIVVLLLLTLVIAVVGLNSLNQQQQPNTRSSKYKYVKFTGGGIYFWYCNKLIDIFCFLLLMYVILVTFFYFCYVQLLY